jgi:hypothetical protein
MTTFLGFVVAVAVYIAFLLWSLAPLVRRRRGAGGWLRIVLGLLLLSANLLPLLGLPVVLVASAFGRETGEGALAVMLFPRTLPIYLHNVHGRASASATVIEIAYPMVIAGVRYTSVVGTACMPRRMLSIDKAVDIKSFENYPTASGGAFVGLAGNATIAIDASSQLCPPGLMGRLQPGTYPDYRSRIGSGLTVYVVRGEADKTQLYELRYHGESVTADDISLQPPQIVRVYQAPARDVVSLDDLWPMRQTGEQSISTPDMITAYRRLPAQENACVHFIIASMDFKELKPKVDRYQMTDFRDMPEAQRPAFCRDVLARRIPRPAAVPIAPSL